MTIAAMIIHALLGFIPVGIPPKLSISNFRISKNQYLFSQSRLQVNYQAFAKKLILLLSYQQLLRGFVLQFNTEP